jgi:sodium/bile acid cotransporter 2
MLTELETKLLGVLMMVIMLGMGALLTWRDFMLSFRKPKGVLIGLLCQYGVMPLLGFALVMVLGLPPALAIGLILMSCMPGGTTSNIFTYFSKGVLALSIVMTCVSTLLALIAVPALLVIYPKLAGISGEFQIPAANVAQVLAIMLIPTIIGMVVRKLNANIGATLEMVGSGLGIVVILFLIVSWVPRNYQLLLSTSWTVYFGVIGLGVIGMVLGYATSRVLRQDKNSARTISLEIGIQNGPLAVLIVTSSLVGTLQQEVLLVPVLYSLFIVLVSSAVTIYFRRLTDIENRAKERFKEGALKAA